MLANWVAKAANLLRDDLDVGPGSVVLLDLPPHWRTLYWAFAAWSVGACVEVPDHRTTADAGQGAARGRRVRGTPDVVVTDAVDVAAAAPTRRCWSPSPPWPARRPGRCPPGVVDEARELATHGDVFDALGRRRTGSDPALRAARPRSPPTTDLVPAPAGAPQRVHTATTDTAAFLRLALGGAGRPTARSSSPGASPTPAVLARAWWPRASPTRADGPSPAVGADRRCRRPRPHRTAGGAYGGQRGIRASTAFQVTVPTTPVWVSLAAFCSALTAVTVVAAVGAVGLDPQRLLQGHDGRALRARLEHGAPVGQQRVHLELEGRPGPARRRRPSPVSLCAVWKRLDRGGGASAPKEPSTTSPPRPRWSTLTAVPVEPTLERWCPCRR